MSRTLIITLSVAGLLVVLIAVLLATKPSLAERQDRGQAALTTACGEIADVTVDRCEYRQHGSFVGASITVSLHTDSASPDVSTEVLTDALKAVLASARASDSDSARIYVTVTDSAGTKHGPEDLGFSSDPDIAELEKRFG